MSGTNREKLSKKPNEIHEKLRILCLHGYRQNGDSFKSKIGSFRKHVQKYAEFVFITAPHCIEVCSDEDSDSAEKSDKKVSTLNNENAHTDDSNDDAVNHKTSTAASDTNMSWWFNKDDNTFKGTNKNGPAYGFDDSLHLVEEAWRTLGPFQGILGFSQGACFVGLICNLSIRGMTVIKPQFAILASGFRSGSLAHLNYYEETILIPSLHIMGISDTIIPSSMSESLAASFEEPRIVRHPGGHYFAATSHQKQFYIDFFRNRLVDHLEKKELEKAEAITLVEPQATSLSMETSDDSD